MKGFKKIFLPILFLLVIAGYYLYATRKTTDSPIKEAIQRAKLPQHIAVMMDGNGRWAQKQGKPRIFGHQNALQSIQELIEGCIELGIPYLTLDAFSTENWGRPSEEVTAIMELIPISLQSTLSRFMENDVKLTVIGEIERLPTYCQEALYKAIEDTKHNKKLHLIVALSYSGRWEISQAAKRIAQEVNQGKIKLADINSELFQNYLSTAGIPDPDMLIRTGGAMRVSNFLLWQIAYTELIIIPTYWPDFRKKHLYEAIVTYQKRERRFGKVHA
jgi:undecaprenyl diphosphate synthase